MATKTVDRVYGTQEKALLAALRGDSGAHLSPFAERGEGVLLVRTMYMLIITIVTEALSKRHNVGDNPDALEQWGKLQASDVQAQLFVTTDLRETDAGTLARKFVTHDREHVVWVEKATLDIWADSARSLSDLQFYSLVYHGIQIEQSAIRVERTKGCVCGYIMPMRGLREQVY